MGRSNRRGSRSGAHQAWRRARWESRLPARRLLAAATPGLLPRAATCAALLPEPAGRAPAMAPASTSLCPARYLVALRGEGDGRWGSAAACRLVGPHPREPQQARDAVTRRALLQAACHRPAAAPARHHAAAAAPPAPVDHQVRAQRDGLLVDGRGKRGVDDHHGALGRAQRLDARDVHAAQVRVGGRLGEEERHLRRAGGGRAGGRAGGWVAPVCARGQSAVGRGVLGRACWSSQLCSGSRSAANHGRPPRCSPSPSRRAPSCGSQQPAASASRQQRRRRRRRRRPPSRCAAPAPPPGRPGPRGRSPWR